MAPMGQKLIQSPQLVHRSRSMTGAEKPFCVMAFWGQTRIEGHGWFCGQRLAWTWTDM